MFKELKSLYRYLVLMIYELSTEIHFAQIISDNIILMKFLSKRRISLNWTNLIYIVFSSTVYYGMFMWLETI